MLTESWTGFQSRALRTPFPPDLSNPKRGEFPPLVHFGLGPNPCVPCWRERGGTEQTRIAAGQSKPSKRQKLERERRGCYKRLAQWWRLHVAELAQRRSAITATWRSSPPVSYLRRLLPATPVGNISS